MKMTTPILRVITSIFVDTTLVDGASDHIIVKASHSYLPMSKEVWKYVLSYIKNKKFEMN